MLAPYGFAPFMAWRFDLYGGTVLLAAGRDAPGGPGQDGAVASLLREDIRIGVREPDVLRGLQRDAQAQAERLLEWLTAERKAGKSVLGYGAASRAVALLLRAGVDRTLLQAVVDSSPAKQGRRMPGTDIPIVDPSRLETERPDTVVLFLPDLMTEVRQAYPWVESAGGTWVDAEGLAS